MMKLRAVYLVQIGEQTIALRPTLRAASYLHEKYDAFQSLAHDIGASHFSAALDLIEACADTTPTATIGEILAARDQLIDFVLILAGAGEKSGSSNAPKGGKPISFDEYHAKLFAIGTGWLGWTAADTWNSTPAEILAARDGWLDMQKALHGSRDDEQAIDATDGSLANARDDLNAIGDMSNHIMGSR